jgi:peptide/nickel transport system permease protein
LIAGCILFFYILRRLGTTLVILLGSSFLIYNLAAFASDPLEELRLSSDPAKEQQIITLTRELNLDVPPPLRYFIWLRGVLGIFVGALDLGNSRAASEPVIDLVLTAVPTTIRLVIGATILAIVLGIALGVVSALRQYSRFDYVMTFVAFLLYSLPVFWVAVLLKQYLAIGFNDFLAPTYSEVDGTLIPPAVTLPWQIIMSLFLAFLIAGIASGSRARVLIIFGTVFVGNFGIIAGLNASGWFGDPAMGPFVFVGLALGLSAGIVYLSVGFANRAAVFASLSMIVIAGLAYPFINYVFDQPGRLISFSLMLLGSAALAVILSLIFAREEKVAIVRTTLITTLGIWFLLVIDKLMTTWWPYMQDEAIYFRPVPTTGQASPLLGTDNFWFSWLDLFLHMFLPTIALTLISFAGYIRFTRGSMLEVLNQDYIRTARAKGLNERTVIMRHAFRNTLIPITTILVVDIAGVIGGAIITERVFGWVGVGTLFNQAITTYDLNLLMGVFLLTGFMALTANLVADLLYSALDPRIRIAGN